jgi:membrane protease YdiL (CAAX protease family)
LHSLVWLAIYLVANTLTDNIAGALNIDFIVVSAVPNLLLAVICFFYLKRTGITSDIGLLTKSTEKSSVMLYYIPLLALPFMNLIYGVKTNLSITKIVLILAMYIGVGFLEEIIFRGLMFKALVKKWNHYIVIVFISLTFAVGHIVIIVAVGQSGINTVSQIVNAFVVGLMFMVIIISSGNLTVCVITHILYNVLANISMVGSTHTEIIMVNVVITLLYFVYLIFRCPNVKAYFGSISSK